MYIQTFSKVTPEEKEQFKNKKFDDFTEFKQNHYK